jgi:DtxR family Mn-dependent transcriptional regulator
VIADLSKSEREALKAIYRHSRNGAVEAHTGDLASTLGVTPGTVTATVKRLADRGLVDHRPYHGVTFTDEGRRQAVAAIRRHRIVERFLADYLGYPWSDADRLAPSFEHELPDEVEKRLYLALDRPATCPHGFPIPEPEQDDLPAMPSLYELEPGEAGEVALPGSLDPAIVAFLEEQGIRPGVHVVVTEKHPFDGPLILDVDGRARTLGERIARRLFVTRFVAVADGHRPPARPAAGPGADTDHSPAPRVDTIEAAPDAAPVPGPASAAPGRPELTDGDAGAAAGRAGRTGGSARRRGRTAAATSSGDDAALEKEGTTR